MVGVKDEGYVKGAGGCVGWLLAGEHPEEVSGVREGRVGRDYFFAFADAVEGGDEHGDLRGEVGRLADIRVVVDGLFVLVVEAERRDGGAQDFHRSGFCGEGLEQVDDLRRRVCGRRPARLEKSASSGLLGSLPCQRRQVVSSNVELTPARECRCRDRRVHRHRRRSSRCRSWLQQCLRVLLKLPQLPYDFIPPTVDPHLI